MRGWWRPFGLCLGMALALEAIVLASGKPIEPAAMLGLPASMAFLATLLVWLGARRPGQFLDGLRDAGAAVEVAEDEMTWVAGRRIVANGPAGAWVVESWSPGNAYLYVTPPGSRTSYATSTNARRAGREAGQRLARGTAAEG